MRCEIIYLYICFFYIFLVRQTFNITIKTVLKNFNYTYATNLSHKKLAIHKFGIKKKKK